MTTEKRQEMIVQIMEACPDELKNDTFHTLAFSCDEDLEIAYADFLKMKAALDKTDMVDSNMPFLWKEK